MVGIYTGSGYDKVKLGELLKEAQEAHHALITGSQAVIVERDGRKVTFTPANIQNLRLYIKDLQGSLAVSNGRGRSPAGMNF